MWEEVFEDYVGVQLGFWGVHGPLIDLRYGFMSLGVLKQVLVVDWSPLSGLWDTGNIWTLCGANEVLEAQLGSLGEVLQ